MLKPDLKSTDLDPYDLVERIAADNPSSDLVHIQRLVRRALAGPDAEYVDAFVDHTTASMLRRYLAREAEKATASLQQKPKPSAPVLVSNSSEKFAAAVQEPRAVQRPIIPTTPRLDPQRQAPAARAYEPAPPPPPPVRSVYIPPREVRVEKPRPTGAKTPMRTVAPEIVDLHIKRARAFLAGSLLRLMMPNGKALGECTLREVDQFGGWFKAIRTTAPKHAPLDAPVSLYFTDEKLRKIQTWSHDVYAD